MELEDYSSDSTSQLFQNTNDQYYLMTDSIDNNKQKKNLNSNIISVQHKVEDSSYYFQQSVHLQSTQQFAIQQINNNHIQQSGNQQNANYKNNDQIIAKPFQIINRDEFDEEVQRPINEDRFFHIAGDILIELCDEQPLDLSGRQKQIFEIIKYETSTRVSLHPAQITDNIKYIMFLLDKSQDQQKHQLSQRINKYSVITKGFNFIVSNLKKTYQQDLEKLYSIAQQREICKQNFISEYIKQNFTKNDYFLIGTNGINFNQENITIKNLQFSFAIEQILGLKNENMAYFALRTGLLDYCGQKSRKQLFNNFMDNFIQMKKGGITLKDFQLSTIDGLTVTCDGFLKNIFCPFPSELQYHSKYPVPPEIEAIFVLTLQINKKHLKHLQTLRSQFQYEVEQKKKHSLKTPYYGKEDLQYSLETQIFMEKYYPHMYEEFEQTQKKHANEERQMQRGECGYRTII